MKKSLLFSLVVICCLINFNYAQAEDIIIVPDVETTKAENIIFSSEKYKITEENGQYEIIDTKTNKNKIGMLAESVELFDDEFENEYKLMFRNKSSNKLIAGYYNTETDNLLVTNYDDISLLNNYLKVKNGDKYGLIDKNGNVILMPIFDRVSIYTQDGKDYLSVKINGKNKLYYSTGKLIPEEELYSVSYDGIYAITADLKPEFKKYVVKARNAKYLTNSVYEVKEVAENAEVEIPENVQIASVEQNVVDTTPKVKSNDTKSIMLGKKQYIVVNDNFKIGLEDLYGNQIIPTIYDRMEITSLKNPIIITTRNNAITAFDVKGKVLAEQIYDKINVYKYGKLYSYTETENGWILKSNNKEIGTLTKIGDDYTFTKNNFNLFSYKKVNDLFMNVIKAFN